jgi:hypothetical protein
MASETRVIDDWPFVADIVHEGRAVLITPKYHSEPLMTVYGCGRFRIETFERYDEVLPTLCAAYPQLLTWGREILEREKGQAE